MENYSVYMHINKQNNKKYIGITSQKPEARWKSGAGYKSQKRFYSAIKSYGWESFDHVVLESGLSKEDAEQKEASLIKKHQSNSLEFGYNIENGGVIHKLSEEQKTHLSLINTGKKHSEETRKKMSKTHLQNGAPWMLGKKHSEITKAKMSEARKGTRNGKAKAVYQYTLDGVFVRKFDYMGLVKDALGISNTSHISQCCANKRNKAYGFKWRYEG